MPTRALTFSLSLTAAFLASAPLAVAQPFVTGPVQTRFGERQECLAVNGGGVFSSVAIRFRDAATGAVVGGGVPQGVAAGATASEVVGGVFPLPERVYCEAQPLGSNAAFRVSLLRRTWAGVVLQSSDGHRVGPSAPGGQATITQACASGPGCFPGDAPGLPVEITMPGSYRLGSNLPAGGTGGIRVLSHDVSIDLGGFSIVGVAECGRQGDEVVCNVVPSQHCIDADGADRVRVENGTVRGCLAGVVLRQNGTIRNLTAHSNAGSGIETSAGCVVADVVASSNKEHGIQVQAGSVIRGSVGRSNGKDGIHCLQSVVENNSTTGNVRDGISCSTSTIQGNASVANGSVGIRADIVGTITGNVVRIAEVGIRSSGSGLVVNNSVWNVDIGMKLGDNTGFRSNVISEAGDADIERAEAGDAVVDLGDNICDAAVCTIVDP